VSRLLFILFYLLQLVGLHATNWCINATNGVNSNAGTNQATAWANMVNVSFGTVKTFAPGDTITISGIFDHSGDTAATALYFPSLTGTAANPILITNYGYACISNSGLNEGQIELQGCAHVHISGINVTNGYRAVSLQNCTNIECDFADWGEGAVQSYAAARNIIPVLFVYNNSQSNYFHDLTVHDDPLGATADASGCISVGLFVTSTDFSGWNVFSNVTCYHAGHQAFGIYGPSNVVLSCFIHNENYGWRVDLGGGTITNGIGYTPSGASGPPNAAHRAMEVGGALGYGCLVQGVRAQYAGFCFNTPHGIELDGPGTNIIRQCVFADNTYSGVAIYGGKTTLSGAPGGTFWGGQHVYNNTLAKNGFGPYPQTQVAPSTCTNYTDNGSGVWTSNSLNANIYVWIPALTITGSTNAQLVNNLFAGNATNIISQIGASASYVSTSNLFCSMAAAGFVDTNDAGPWSTVLPNYHLTFGSAAKETGAFLTTVTSASGNGITVTVADASYFFAGLNNGLCTVAADSVQLQGQSATAQITAIVGNTITLASPLSWTSGQGIALPYSGAAPNVGALASLTSASTTVFQGGAGETVTSGAVNSVITSP
jgi:hypothetical protein